MYISNGIAYAGEQEPVIKVCGVRPLPGHRLWLRFTTGEAKVPAFMNILSINCGCLNRILNQVPNLLFSLF